MIPFASERGNGQDLAAHLQNAHDNEYVEIADMRGAVARDLHGAFAEWAAQARALTRCSNYMCSLSINPDQLQGRISRDQYFDYIARTEQKLGLADQPRAVVFHIKDGREHCHVIWSRIDVEAGKAVNLAFYKDKLMTVTREFARDHGLQLPQGYYAHEDRQWRKNRQLSRYESIKEKETGISHEERMAAITEAWKGSDSGAAFVHALEERGYMLACGRNKSRPVLVDIYGHTYALTRLIDDKAVKTRQVRDRLGADYAPENLPTVEQAQDVATDRRRAIEDFEKARAESEAVAQLLRTQEQRRTTLDGKIAMLEVAQMAKRQMLLADQLSARRRLRAGLVSDLRQRRAARAQNRPEGLAAFLGRITGVTLITKKLHEHRDRQLAKTYRTDRQALGRRQNDERAALDRRLDAQAADLTRERRGLEQIEKKELASLQQAQRREQRQKSQQRHVHSPTFSLNFKPGGRPAAPHKAANRHISETKRALDEQEKRDTAHPPQKPKRINLIDAFTRAAGDDDGDDGSGGGGDTGGHGPRPPTKPKGPDRPTRRKRRTRRRDKDFDRGM